MTESADLVERLRRLQAPPRKRVAAVMRKHYAVLYERVHVGRVNWDQIGAELAVDGYVRADGTPWPASELSRIWSRIKQERGEG